MVWFLRKTIWPYETDLGRKFKVKGIVAWLHVGFQLALDVVSRGNLRSTRFELGRSLTTNGFRIDFILGRIVILFARGDFNAIMADLGPKGTANVGQLVLAFGISSTTSWTAAVWLKDDNNSAERLSVKRDGSLYPTQVRLIARSTTA